VWDTPQKRLFEFLNLNSFAKIIFLAKYILNMNQGPRWSCVMKKFACKKSGGTVPFRKRDIILEQVKIGTDRPWLL
jgi:hypothetical protein